MSLRAFVAGRPGRSLTDQSPGCLLKDGYWVIQCGRSDISWTVGDTLVVFLVDEERNRQVQRSIVLSANPVDEGGGLKFGDFGVIPEQFALEPNYPNPFNGETVLRICLPEDADVQLDLVNSLGQTVRNWAGGKWTAGTHEVRWDGKDGLGNEMSSGMYIFRLRTGERFFLQKAVLLR